MLGCGPETPICPMKQAGFPGDLGTGKASSHFILFHSSSLVIERGCLCFATQSSHHRAAGTTVVKFGGTLKESNPGVWWPPLTFAGALDLLLLDPLSIRKVKIT